MNKAILNFYCNEIEGAIEVLKAISSTNELIVCYRANGSDQTEIWKLSEAIKRFENGTYRLTPSIDFKTIIADPGELSIVRMALPSLFDQINQNISKININTPDGYILLGIYEGYLKNIQSLIKKLNA